MVTLPNEYLNDSSADFVIHFKVIVVVIATPFADPCETTHLVFFWSVTFCDGVEIFTNADTNFRGCVSKENINAVDEDTFSFSGDKIFQQHVGTSRLKHRYVWGTCSNPIIPVGGSKGQSVSEDMTNL